ncbi:hypothetical protein NP493_1680g00013 [Ridgeia piscesae]|uniref:Uncharacterized protein n=1 Tax=Ridgeia piscesae TaxID=27915 RepID=A0AAD9JW81_RIDPI|nr:hypothetical protein NP493_1680g00013 [Ridgeia piscesae]
MRANESIPYRYTDGVRRFDSCVVYANYSSDTNLTIPCQHGWEYEHDSLTITEQWDLVCDKNYWTETTQTMLVIGVLIGAVTMTNVADRFGRKRTFLMNSCAGSFIVFLTAMVDNYYLFAALRLLLGVFLHGAEISGFVLACELFPANYRTTAGILAWIYWPIGMVMLAGIAFLIRNWRYLLIATSLPGMCVVPLFWIIPESVPWLIAKNRIDEAKEIVQSAATSNNIELPKKYRHDQKDISSAVYSIDNGDNVAIGESGEMTTKQTTEAESQECTLLDVMSSRTLRLYSAALFYLWFVVCLVYYGLSLSSGTLAGNKYVNFFLSGFVEVPAILFCIPLFNRNIGLGIGSAAGRFGNMLAPFSTYFARVAPWFPGLVFGTLSVVGVVLDTFLLIGPRRVPFTVPETIISGDSVVKCRRRHRAGSGGTAPRLQSSESVLVFVDGYNVPPSWLSREA